MSNSFTAPNSTGAIGEDEAALGGRASSPPVPAPAAIGRVDLVQDRLRAALADRYTVADPIGEGGMATVYRATDLKHHRAVAIKVLRPELARATFTTRYPDDPERIPRLARFRVRELRIGAFRVRVAALRPAQRRGSGRPAGR
jgi:hypothetical protein